jgi:hypothetical protein
LKPTSSWELVKFRKIGFRLDESGPVPIRGGELGGPVAFFDADGTRVVVLSPMSQFMIANMEVRSVQ